MTRARLAHRREFLKSGDWALWAQLQTPQRRGEPPPPLQKPVAADAVLVDLVPPADLTIGNLSVIEAIRGRRSRRTYAAEALTLEEVSFLLWATGGLHKIVGEGRASLRSAPSAGARHPFETYLLINRVEGMEAGTLARYLPLSHQLCVLKHDPDLPAEIDAASLGQYVRTSAVTFIWTAIPARTEWRYDILAHRVILIDVGHVCQNLYLACEAIHAGTCAVGAYDQERLDSLLGVDGTDEFTIYLAPVGKVKED
jgi:SagB-type dehydrogenase family enzyme